MRANSRGFDSLQKISMTFMAFMVLLTFVGANLHALLWQSSEWLVSTVLPAVVVQLTNEERASNSELPLRRNTTLDQAAQLKAKHMAENEYFSHFSPKGVSPWHWFDQAGYVYAHAGENLAIHFTDSSEVVEAWMASPTHRENIVNGMYTEIGVGTAKGKFDGYDTVYVVQLFGTPAVPPVKVDNTEPLAVYDTAETTPDADLSKSKEQVVINTNDEAILITENTELDNSSVVAEESSETVLILETDNQNQQTSVGPETNTESVAIDDSEQRRNTESLLIDDNLKVSTNENNIVVRSPVIATSSGLAIAQIDTKINSSHAGGTLASIATQPNAVLQFIYTLLALAVVMMLGTSIVIEAKRFNYSQVAYGFLLLFGMGGLWFMHSLLTTGAVVT